MRYQRMRMHVAAGLIAAGLLLTGAAPGALGQEPPPKTFAEYRRASADLKDAYVGYIMNGIGISFEKLSRYYSKPHQEALYRCFVSPADVMIALGTKTGSEYGPRPMRDVVFEGFFEACQKDKQRKGR